MPVSQLSIYLFVVTRNTNKEPFNRWVHQVQELSMKREELSEEADSLEKTCITLKDQVLNFIHDI